LASESLDTAMGGFADQISHQYSINEISRWERALES
jgi:hypothetical protein